MLSGEDIWQLATIDLRARAIAEGAMAGQHRSKAIGASTEFRDHKPYVAGDDLRTLDWRAYARRDRHVVRRYEAERRLDIFVVVDTSGSMAYAGGATGKVGRSKLEVAATLAAGILWLAQKKRDRVSLSLFADTLHSHTPLSARRDHMYSAMATLEGVKASGPTQVGDALAAMASRIRDNALVVVISDLLDDDTSAMRHLGALRKRGADAVVMHLLHKDEVDFPFDGVVRFLDLESDGFAQVDAPGVRSAYLEEMRRFLRDSETQATRRDIRYSLSTTDEPLAVVLQRALAGHELLG